MKVDYCVNHGSERADGTDRRCFFVEFCLEVRGYLPKWAKPDCDIQPLTLTLPSELHSHTPPPFGGLER